MSFKRILYTLIKLLFDILADGGSCSASKCICLGKQDVIILFGLCVAVVLLSAVDLLENNTQSSGHGNNSNFTIKPERAIFKRVKWTENCFNYD